MSEGSSLESRTLLPACRDEGDLDPSYARRSQLHILGRLVEFLPIYAVISYEFARLKDLRRRACLQGPLHYFRHYLMQVAVEGRNDGIER